MPNRSISALPSFYAPAHLHWLSTPTHGPGPLEVFDITYLHFHSSLELGVCASGQGVCIVEGREYPFSEGDVQIIFPFQRHLSRSAGDSFSRWYWLNIDPMQLLGAWGAPDLPRVKRLLETGMGLWGIIEKERYPLLAGLIRRVTLAEEENRRLACLYALIEELAVASADLPHLTLRPSRRFTQLEPALDAVPLALKQGEVPRVSDLARACSLSPAPFRRAFHQAMGQSPQQYIENCQMKKAQQLLLFTDQPITQIAFSVGYQDVSGFNRQFLRAFGMAPRAYRLCGGE